jgi:hypothetical protein
MVMAGKDNVLASSRHIGFTCAAAPSLAGLLSPLAESAARHGRAHLFHAQHARWCGKINTDDLEEQEVVLLSRAEKELTFPSL